MYVAQQLDSVPAEPLDSLLQLACSKFNVSAALLVLCGDRCVRIVRAHCTQGEFKVGQFAVQVWLQRHRGSRSRQVN
jgi:hypothetical protein